MALSHIKLAILVLSSLVSLSMGEIIALANGYASGAWSFLDSLLLWLDCRATGLGRLCRHAYWNDGAVGGTTRVRNLWRREHLHFAHPAWRYCRICVRGIRQEQRKELLLLEALAARPVQTARWRKLRTNLQVRSPSPIRDHQSGLPDFHLIGRSRRGLQRRKRLLVCLDTNPIPILQRAASSCH
jgi:hypothetical protein